MPSIIIISGPQRGHRVSLDRATIVIGRDAECGLRLNDGRTSRRHAEVGFDDDAETYFVRDLGSTNGVRLGERRIEEAQLRNGDVIVVGDCSMMFSDRDFTDDQSALAWAEEQPAETGPTIANRRPADDWRNA